MHCCVADKYNYWCHDAEAFIEYNGKAYCIFHAPLDSKQKLEKWDNKLIYDRINAGKNCFSGTIFPISINWPSKNINGSNKIYNNLDLSFSFFKENVVFRNINFTGVTKIVNVVFNEKVSFSDTYFQGEAIFMASEFYDEALFLYLRFNGRALFSHALFKSSVAFLGSVFSKEAYFCRSFFGDKSSFTGAVFRGAADFRLSVWDGKSFFINTQFDSRSTFEKASFGIVEFSSASFVKPAFFCLTTFSKANFSEVLVEENIIFDRADLQSVSFLGSPIENFRFISCLWPKTKSRNIVFDARKVNKRGYFPLNNKKSDIPLDEVPEAIHLEDLFRRLKKIAKNENDEIMASDWHYNEKEMLRLRLAESNDSFTWKQCCKNFFALELKKTGKWWNDFFLYEATSLYKTLSGYGEEPLRALICLVILVLLPALPWVFPGDMMYYIPLSKARPDVSEFFELTRLWMILWQIIITIQAGLFGFSLRNKFRR